jgi:hypothetical protein
MSKFPNYVPNYVAIPVLGVGLGFGLFIAYQSFIQQPASAVAANAPDNKSPAPAAAANAPDNNSESKYTECVFERLRAQKAANEAAKDRFVRNTHGMTFGQMMLLSQIIPPRSAADIAMAQRQRFMLIKETCRLKFPCAADEVVSEDYNTCFKRQAR